MTSAQLEHLKLIDAHLERLLDIADKRALGPMYAREWRICDESGRQFATTLSPDFGGVRCMHNAAFIASAAGNAEAGWRATRAAIAALSKIAEEREPVEHGDSGDGPYVSMLRTSAAHFAEQTLNDIIAAFPNV